MIFKLGVLKGSDLDILPVNHQGVRRNGFMYDTVSADDDIIADSHVL